jgi:hypothetical protein
MQLWSRASNRTARLCAGAAGYRTHSLVLSLLQTATPGVLVASAVPHASTGNVTISLNKAPGSRAHPAAAKVAWFVIN